MNHNTESKLLLTCAGTNANRENISALVKPDLDWAYFISTARRHGVLPLVYQRLRACREGLPADVLHSLEKYFYLNSSRNLYQAEILVELLQSLHSQDISAVPYKGPALCCQVYGSLGLREFGDLDILLRPKDVAKARSILGESGYRATLDLTREQEKAFLTSNHAYSMIREKDRTVVELHWRFTPRYFSHALNLPAIWRRLIEISLNGTRVPGLSQEDLLLVLSAHGTKHCWDRLLFICDVAHLIRAHPQTNWATVIARAKKSGGLRMLNTAILSAHKLLGGDLPDQMKVQIEKDVPAQTLTARIEERLFTTETTPGELVRVPFHLKARERIRDKIFYLVLFFITPTMEDFKTFRLPASLFPLYSFTRPLRLFLLSMRRKYMPGYKTV